MKKVLEDGFVLLKNDIKSAKWAIMIIIAYFVLGNKVLHSTCPLVWLTGFPCPACGLTRAGIRLLHLDFKGAWEMHPFIYVVGICPAVFAWNRYIFKRKVGNILKSALILVIVAMIIYYIWRMYCFFPKVPPMTYYRYNLLRMLGVAFGIVK